MRLAAIKGQRQKDTPWAREVSTAPVGICIGLIGRTKTFLRDSRRKSEFGGVSRERHWLPCTHTCDLKGQHSMQVRAGVLRSTEFRDEFLHVM